MSRSARAVGMRFTIAHKLMNKYYWFLKRECRDKLTPSCRTDQYAFLTYSTTCESVFHYTCDNTEEEPTMFSSFQFHELCKRFRLNPKHYIKIDENGELLNE